MAQWDPGRVRGRSRLHAMARLVRIEHTLFSLPFAYAGAILSGHPFSLGDALLIFLAVLGLRTAAMSYNNIADLNIDRLNPRSKMRPLVTGAVTIREAYALVAAGTLLYYASAALLNKWALLLSPLLWIAAMTYPYAKRIHSMPHIHLGLVLGLVVFGGAVAASGDELACLRCVLGSVPWDYVAGVTLWVAGFDMVYSVMDMEFDREHGLGSAPALLGARRTILLALALHIVASALLVWGAVSRGYRLLGLVGTLAGSAVMIYSDLRALRDLGEIPWAFNANLVVGLLVSLGIIGDYLILLRA